MGAGRGRRAGRDGRVGDTASTSPLRDAWCRMRAGPGPRGPAARRGPSAPARAGGSRAAPAPPPGGRARGGRRRRRRAPDDAAFGDLDVVGHDGATASSSSPSARPARRRAAPAAPGGRGEVGDAGEHGVAHRHGEPLAWAATSSVTRKGLPASPRGRAGRRAGERGDGADGQRAQLGAPGRRGRQAAEQALQPGARLDLVVAVAQHEDRGEPFDAAGGHREHVQRRLVGQCTSSTTRTVAVLQLGQHRVVHGVGAAAGEGLRSAGASRATSWKGPRVREVTRSSHAPRGGTPTARRRGCRSVRSTVVLPRPASPARSTVRPVPPRASARAASSSARTSSARARKGHRRFTAPGPGTSGSRGRSGWAPRRPCGSRSGRRRPRRGGSR